LKVLVWRWQLQRCSWKTVTIAGLLSGLAGVMTAARASTGQARMGLGYELDAIAAKA
jgi:ribose/xylose/arabinose/galactoside ABC-type transport system permease subunit